jgi:pyrroloquinoline quinone biosynthesis protein B
MKDLFLFVIYYLAIPAALAQVDVLVLGNVQDAGSPHPGCQKDCCADLWLNPDPNRRVVSLGVIDRNREQTYLIEATPDLPAQLDYLHSKLQFDHGILPDAIFLTHAHIGHYTGLMYLGREGLGTKGVDVYAMPRMKTFLELNGPWSQLVALRNIELHELDAGSKTKLSHYLQVTPILVPHRDEYSETVGYLIKGQEKTMLFIPDIDKWYRWETDIRELVKEVDYALLDASFYADGEIPRDIGEIPHPFVVESMALFDELSDRDRNKIWFIHLNHTNPLLDSDSEESSEVQRKGYHVARLGDSFRL